MVEHLEGMFAFAVVDRHTGDVFLARDRFGKKPLYWTRVGDGIAFASTLDALIELLPQRPDLDPRAIAEYLVLQYVPGSHSPWQGIEKLEPGTWLRLHAGVIEKERYWSPRSLSRIARSTGQRRGSIYGSGSGPRSKLGSRARCRWGCS